MNDAPIFIEGREYLTLKKAAQRSGYDLRTINRLARSGKIDAKPVGSTWVIATDALARYRAVKPQRKPRTEVGRRCKPRAAVG